VLKFVIEDSCCFLVSSAYKTVDRLVSSKFRSNSISGKRIIRAECKDCRCLMSNVKTGELLISRFMYLELYIRGYNVSLKVISQVTRCHQFCISGASLDISLHHEVLPVSCVLGCCLLDLKWPNPSYCRSQWPRGLRHGSTAARLLGLWARIPPGAWMSVACEC
jgi:hypothetical protein